MTRPLRYDDAFNNILKEKMHEKFLNMLNLKVQSTTFCQKLNLQKGLFISALWEIIYGCVIFVYFLNHYHRHIRNSIFIAENILCIISLFFGILGTDAAINLKKLNSRIYKNWRILFTFLYFVIEIGNHFTFPCNFDRDCTTIEKTLFFILFILWNCYITKISWSFSVRLEQSHELLIIHGRYLEKMLGEESYKLHDNKKYTPPGETPGKIKDSREPRLFADKNIKLETPLKGDIRESFKSGGSTELGPAAKLTKK